MTEGTLKEMIRWTREDLKLASAQQHVDFMAFVERHDEIHDNLDKKLEKLSGFRVKVIGISAGVSGLISIIALVVRLVG